jgi:hypothetical protein
LPPALLPGRAFIAQLTALLDSLLAQPVAALTSPAGGTYTPPIEAKSHAEAGFRFVSWSGDTHVQELPDAQNVLFFTHSGHM